MFFTIIISAVHVLGGFPPIVKSLQNCMCSLGYCHAFPLSTAGVDVLFQPNHTSGRQRFSAHHQELIKLYVQPWVLSCFTAVYHWCGWVVPTQPH